VAELFATEFRAAPVTLTLAVAAIIFASIQFCDSLDLKRRIRIVLSKEEEVLTRMENVAQQIESVGRSLSSRYVGTFPKNIKQIIEVVRNADRFVLILTDWVGYAMYSMPQEYEDYKRHLHDLRVREAQPVPVYMAAYDVSCLKAHFKDQFPETLFANEKQNPRFHKFFDRYRHAKPEPGTYAEFLAEMLAIEQEQRAEMKNLGVELQELSQRSLLLLWMEDGEDAVFCFQTHGGTERGLCFRTRDISLITTLRDLLSSKWTGDLPALPHEHPVISDATKASVKIV
jgi:hypothetical protein